ncbi:ubiquinol-cytochrome c reductase iron-sulfur subunit [Labrys monachus]|uniref:Ubiquinol-cytochrome c reductase iron-sulfur subunit n=1 Tax=Labrys monachus TaxID=217067 RepID=A0ABU0FJ99_9HYPH|nr:ubiquinol-cytochrome c reductase iron-sulfur subunit [Labrys monachus]MDQ0394689.1 ubiquinol-cytochrome c reductase iron-sulfur subunit [Labrys monachus]
MYEKDRSVAATNEHAAEPTRRDFIYIATGAVGAVGVAGAIWPFIDQMEPDKATIAAGVPVEVDLTPIPEGQSIKVFWRGKPIFVRHRTKQEIAAADNVDISSLRDPQSDADRVKKGDEQWLIVIGICTHLGCIPLVNEGPYHGWFCPCHGSVYDTSGRIRQGPAPLNLAVPPYSFEGQSKIIIGADSGSNAKA